MTRSNWPADTQGGEKNTGVAQLIKQTDGAIGYVDLADAGERGPEVRRRSRTRTASSSSRRSTAPPPRSPAPTVKDDLTYDPLNAAGADDLPDHRADLHPGTRSSRRRRRPKRSRASSSTCSPTARGSPTTCGFATARAEPGREGARPAQTRSGPRTEPAWRPATCPSERRRRPDRLDRGRAPLAPTRAFRWTSRWRRVCWCWPSWPRS